MSTSSACDAARPATRTRRFGAARLVATGALLLAATASLSVPAGASTAATGVIGHLDTATTSSGGSIAVRGWVADQAAPSTPIHVSITTTDARGTVTVTQLLANEARPDVAAAYPALGPNHGFSVPLYVAPGSYRVCASASSVSGSAHFSQCLPADVPVDHLPIGHLDAVRTLPNNDVQVSGWALDPDTMTAADRVTITLGGTFYAAYKAVTVTANQPRPDVAQAVPGAGPNHGFSAVIAARPGSYPICAYGINNYLYGAPRLLGCLTAHV